MEEIIRFVDGKTDSSLFEEKGFDFVLDLLTSETNAPYVQSHAWSLLAGVCRAAKDRVRSEEDVEGCRRLLLHLVSLCSAKEAVVALMEEADTFTSHSHFRVLLEPLRVALKVVPGKRGRSLDWVLSTLNAHLYLLPPPEDLDLQGEEKLLLDADPAVADASLVLADYLPFVESFVDEVSFAEMRSAEDYYEERLLGQRSILARYLLVLLCRPFLYHDLHAEPSPRPKSTLRVLCEACIRCLSKVCSNVFDVCDHPRRFDAPNAAETDLVPDLAFANLSYLTFVENACLAFQPFVYSNAHLFERHLSHALVLLRRTENLVLFKGLHLAEALLDRLRDLQLEFAERKDLTDFSTQLLHVAVFSQIEAHRKKALDTFLLCVRKCDWKGRRHLIVRVLDASDHSGCQGLAINLYRSHLHDSLLGKVPGDCFLGENLTRFLRKVFLLKDGAETDLLDNVDRILSSLNLLRYLLLRDDEGATGIRRLLPAIYENFLDPLQTGLDMSRAHYQKAAQDSDWRLPKSTVTVNDAMLPSVPLRFQKDVLQRALLTFDLIESVLARVRELQ